MKSEPSTVASVASSSPVAARTSLTSTRGSATVNSTCVSAPSSSTTSTFTSMRGSDGSAKAPSSNASGRRPTITRPVGGASAEESGIAKPPKRTWPFATSASTRFIAGEPMNAAT